MKNRILASLGCALAACFWLGSGTGLPAQTPSPTGGFSPQNMRQQMLTRLRQQFDVKEDAEWSLISERLNKVLEAQRALRGFGGMGGPGGPPPMAAARQRPPSPDTPNGDPLPGPPDGEGPGADPAGHNGPEAAAASERPWAGAGGPMGIRPESSVELEALRKSIDGKATAAELKAKLAQLRDARAKKEAALAAAREELKQVLSTRQEAIAVAAGLLQ